MGLGGFALRDFEAALELKHAPLVVTGQGLPQTPIANGFVRMPKVLLGIILRVCSSSQKQNAKHKVCVKHVFVQQGNLVTVSKYPPLVFAWTRLLLFFSSSGLPSCASV